MFFLNSSLLFVPKPICHIQFRDILQVEFHRMEDNLSNRNVDFEIISKAGEKTLFSGIDKSESQGIFNYFKEKQVKVLLIQEEANVNGEDYDEEEDEDDDENNEF